MSNRISVFWQKLISWLGVGGFLCDTCKFDHPTACRRPERPNAKVCPDYERR